MCGIAGIIYRGDGNGAHHVGRDMTSMLQSMKHRGPDSTGYALYHAPAPGADRARSIWPSPRPRAISTSPNR